MTQFSTINNIFILPSFGQAQQTSTIKPLTVVTTTSIFADMLMNVGGECVTVKALVGNNNDPHVHVLQARDIQTFANSDVIFYGGYNLEGQLGNVLNSFAKSDKTPTIALYPRVFTENDFILPHTSTKQTLNGADPHIWMDVNMWQKLIPEVLATLVSLQPECETLMNEQTEQYSQLLTSLDSWIKTTIETIPERQRVIITAHNSLSYYALAYNMETLGLQGVSTESQAGVADVRALADLIEARAIPAIFPEKTINSRPMQAVVDAVQSQGQDLMLAPKIIVDALGTPEELEGSYVGMLYSNTKNIAESLGGHPVPLPNNLSQELDQWLNISN